MLKPTLALLMAATAGVAAAHPPHGAHEARRGTHHASPPVPLGPSAQPAPPLEVAPSDAPPRARPGECYARLRIPPRTEIYQEQVLVEPERVERRHIPPRFRPTPRDLVVREGSSHVEVIEPVYETVPETVLVEPGRHETVREPARLGTVRETVPVEPPRLVWKLVHSPLQPAPVWCLIEEPGRAETVERTVVLEPERTRVVAHPPRYATVPRQVLRRPGETREVVVPPEVRTVIVQDLVEPGRVEEVRKPPRYASVSKSRVVEPERTAWTPVLCEADATPHRIKALQSALRARGYYKGKVDGLYGPATAEAVVRFQRDQNLPHAGFLSLPTLAKLGVGAPRHAAPPVAAKGQGT